MKKEYVILGSDNFWYSSGLKSIKAVLEEVENIRRNPETYGVPGGSNQTETPDTLYIYYGSQIKKIDIET